MTKHSTTYIYVYTVGYTYTNTCILYKYIKSTVLCLLCFEVPVVSAESVTEQRARSRDRRHEASTVGVTATMACAVGAIKLRQSGIVPARSTSTSSFLLSSSLAVAAHSFQTTPL